MTDQNQKNTSVSQVEEDEIDLIAIAKTLWEGRKTIVKTTLIFMALGLFVAIFSEKEYTSTTKILPQSSDAKSIGGDLGSLAAMAGVNLGNVMGQSGIPPILYPEILGSIAFQKELLQTKLSIEGQENKVTYYDYYLNIHTPSLLGYVKEYTVGLPKLLMSEIKNLFKNQTFSSSEKKFVSVSEDEFMMIDKLLENVSVVLDKQSEFVTISAVMPEPFAAAEMVESAKELLQKSIINIKIKKSLEKLNFIKKRHFEKEVEFKKAQEQLALFKDRNVVLNTASSRITVEKLQSDYELAYNIYSGLKKQLEACKIEVKEDTPVFSTIDPVSIPYEKSAPKRFLTLLIYTFFGIFLGISLIFGKSYLVKVKKKLQIN
jgi:uncharacterized protein involved in exopolysaccharide biosynthesis